jgi:hypothetical protein
MTNFLFLLYIQGKRSMAAILNFINAMIFFFSLFLVVTNVDGNPFFHPFQIFLFTYTQYFINYILSLIIYTCFTSQHLVVARIKLIVQIICAHLLKLESVILIIVTASKGKLKIYLFLLKLYNFIYMLLLLFLTYCILYFSNCLITMI